jgi:hypothetical protein
MRAEPEKLIVTKQCQLRRSLMDLHQNRAARMGLSPRLPTDASRAGKNARLTFRSREQLAIIPRVRNDPRGRPAARWSSRSSRCAASVGPPCASLRPPAVDRPPSAAFSGALPATIRASLHMSSRQLGIRHLRTHPYTPCTNGKAECFIWHRPHASLVSVAKPYFGEKI